MIKSARRHSEKYGYQLRTYDDASRHMIGFVCEVTGTVFQIDLVTAGDQMEQAPAARAAFLSRDGREAVARLLSRTGRAPREWEKAWEELCVEMAESRP